jgi:hypothetical protein
MTTGFLEHLQGLLIALDYVLPLESDSLPMALQHVFEPCPPLY